MRKISLLLFVSCALGQAHGRQVIKVPQGDGTPVLIDGRLSADEWRDAAVIPAAPSVKLYLKQFGGHVYVGVKTEAATPSYVDVFLLAGDGRLYNLHASMQIGERLLPGGGAWDDSSPPNRWGNHVDWIASEAKIDAGKDRDLPIPKRLFPYDGMEFQIRRARFVGERWRVRIEVRDFAGQSPDTVFPAASDRKDPARWAALELGEPEPRPKSRRAGRRHHLAPGSQTYSRSRMLKPD